MNPKVIFYTVALLSIIYLLWRDVWLLRRYRRNAILYEFCQVRREFIRSFYSKKVKPDTLVSTIYLNSLNHVIHFFDEFKREFNIFSLLRAIRNSRDDVEFTKFHQKVLSELYASDEYTQRLIGRYYSVLTESIEKSAPFGRYGVKLLMSRPAQKFADFILHERALDSIEIIKEIERDNFEINEKLPHACTA